MMLFAGNWRSRSLLSNGADCSALAANKVKPGQDEHGLKDGMRPLGMLAKYLTCRLSALTVSCVISF